MLYLQPWRLRSCGCCCAFCCLRCFWTSSHSHPALRLRPLALRRLPLLSRWRWWQICTWPVPALIGSIVFDASLSCSPRSGYFIQLSLFFDFPTPPSPLPFLSGVGWLERFSLCTSSKNEGQRNQLDSSSKPNGSPVKRKGRRKFSRDFSFEVCFLYQSSNLWRLRVYHKALDLALMLKLWFVPPYF